MSTLARRSLERRLAYRTSRNPTLRLLRELSRETQVTVWLVGGAVRNAALGLPGKDLDLVSGPGTRRLIPRIQEALQSKGHRFRKRGVTTWRFLGADDGLDLVDASRRGVEADLRRRELTLNAIGYDLVEARLIDPLGGLADLRRGRLRMPTASAFAEDPLRALRLARFRAQFPGFSIESATRAAAGAQAGRLRRKAVERIREELDKTLVARAPHVGLGEIDALGLLPAVLPELTPMQECAAGDRRPDVWTHTLMALERSTRAARLPGGDIMRDAEQRSLLRWSLLLHDIAKPDTIDERGERPTFHGHEVLGAGAASRLLERLRAPKAFRRRVSNLVAWHLRPGHLADAGAPSRGIRRLAAEAADDLPVLVLHAACDALGSGVEDPRRWAGLRGVLRRLLASPRRLADRKPLLSGNEVMELLNLEPGPQVGRALSLLADAVHGDEVHNRRQARRYLRDAWARRSGEGG